MPGEQEGLPGEVTPALGSLGACVSCVLSSCVLLSTSLTSHPQMFRVSRQPCLEAPAMWGLGSSSSLVPSPEDLGAWGGAV